MIGYLLKNINLVEEIKMNFIKMVILLIIGGIFVFWIYRVSKKEDNKSSDSA